MGLSRVSCPEAASPVARRGDRAAQPAGGGPWGARPHPSRNRTRAATATEAAIARDVDTQPYVATVRR